MVDNSLRIRRDGGGGDGYEKAKGQTRFFQSDCSVCGSIFTLDRAVNFLKFL